MCSALYIVQCCTVYIALGSVQGAVCSACLGVIVQCTVHQCASPNCSIGLCEKQPLAPTHLYLETHHHHLLHHQDLHHHYYHHKFIFNIITKVFIITIISSDITF